MTFYLLVVIAILNALATIALWQKTARKLDRPAKKLKKEFIAALLHSEPITPKYQRPKAIGEGWKSLVRTEDRQFFDEFKDFADVVNQWFAVIEARWRLQELPDTLLKLTASDSACFGRRYNIFHNQVSVGSLEISPAPRSDQDVRAEVRLDWVRLLTFKRVVAFLDGIAMHISGETDPASRESLRAREAIYRSLTATLWQTRQISEFEDFDYGELELTIEGPAIRYLRIRGHPAFAA